jgi:hypothetical protein
MNQFNPDKIDLDWNDIIDLKGWAGLPTSSGEVPSIINQYQLKLSIIKFSVLFVAKINYFQ